ncbi:MoaD/ThiS family protein [Pseudothermotoga sp. U03pept]|uniref:MoaD/ThiS family protein n=1 Tax=Pseudothermotoga sp. U03pept TaxID=3447012 RepID=UPI003F0CB54F
MDHITVLYQGKIYEFERSLTVKEILKKLGLNSEEHVVVVDDEIYTEDRIVKTGSRVVIHKVTSAG